MSSNPPRDLPWSPARSREEMQDESVAAFWRRWKERARNPPSGWLANSEHDTCEYCGTEGPCRPDPFGQAPSCWPCFDQIIGGDE